MINNTWHTYNESDTVYIFVHGFFSNSQACWTSKEGVRWPDLVSTDARLGEPAIFTAGYYTAVDSGDYKIADCARELYDALRVPHIGGKLPPITKCRLVFVCHSLGGIVTRYMIERNREAFKEKSIALILIASPSYGASLASSLGGLIKLYKNRLAEQLTAANESLDDLDDRFKELLAANKISCLVGAEAYEHHFPIHWKFIPALRPIVSKSSASRYFGPSKLLPGTDHSTCVKPTSHEHVSHQFLVSKILDIFPPAATHARSGLSNASVSPTGILDKARSPNEEVLFEVYKAEYEKYYIDRKVDDDVKLALQILSLWVYGTSGVGKTAAIHRATSDQNNSVIHVYIGATADLSAGAIGMLREIYYTIAMNLDSDYRVSNSINEVVADIVKLLVVAAKNRPIYLVIDEVPLIERGSEEISTFVSALHAILISAKQLIGPGRLKLVVTSIFDPRVYLKAGSERVFEQIRFLEFCPWQNDELDRLVSLISSYIPNAIKYESDLATLVKYSDGSPRFVKVFFRSATLDAVEDEGKFKSRLKEIGLMLGQSMPQNFEIQ